MIRWFPSNYIRRLRQNEEIGYKYTCHSLPWLRTLYALFFITAKASRKAADSCWSYPLDEGAQVCKREWKSAL